MTQTPPESTENKRTDLGAFEELVLIAVARLGERAYGVPIRKALADATNRDVAIGAVYTTLDRLEQKGLVSSYEGGATQARGGRAKRYYRIEAEGLKALKAADDIRNQLRATSTIGLNPVGSVI